MPATARLATVTVQTPPSPMKSWSVYVQSNSPVAAQ
jgi:hypothetical protein